MRFFLFSNDYGGYRMKTAGIVAEFNPFHQGHRYLIQQARSHGADNIICVMSGNFVQRCEPAFFEKHIRAKSAVDNGADLVIELPFRFSVASAEKFARGAVYLLSECGIDTLAFGSECGERERLKNIAYTLLDADNSEEFRNELKKGISFASARNNILRRHGIDLSLPNDILAVEYIKALTVLGYDADIFTVRRTDDYLSSASEIRSNLLGGEYGILTEDLKKEIYSSRAPAQMDNIEKILIAFLRNTTEKDMENVYAVNTEEGMHKRLLAAGKEICLEDVFNAVKTKRFAFSAVKRALLSAYFRLPDDDTLPPYIRILAMNDKGRAIVRNMRKKTDLPIVSNLSKLRQEPECSVFADEERRATDLFNLALPVPGRGMTEFTDKTSF